MEQIKALRFIIFATVGAIIVLFAVRYAIDNMPIDKGSRETLSYFCQEASPFYEECKKAEADGKITSEEFISLSIKIDEAHKASSNAPAETEREDVWFSWIIKLFEYKLTVVVIIAIQIILFVVAYRDFERVNRVRKSSNDDQNKGSYMKFTKREISIVGITLVIGAIGGVAYSGVSSNYSRLISEFKPTFDWQRSDIKTTSIVETLFPSMKPYIEMGMKADKTHMCNFAKAAVDSNKSSYDGIAFWMEYNNKECQNVKTELDLSAESPLYPGSRLGK